MPEADAENIHSAFEPNIAVIRQHLERMFRRVRAIYPGGLCEIAWTNNNGQITLGQLFPITPAGLDEAAAFAVARNREKRNVYYGVNPRKPGTAPFARADSSDVDMALFQFADCDSVEATTALRKTPVAYSFAVTTGRVPNPRVHPYFELDEPVYNLEAWSRQQRAIADYFDSDPVIDPPRVMRLAGTVSYPNAKKAERGYHVEQVTIRTLYDHEEERDPVTSEALYTAFPWMGNARETRDRETGEASREERARPDFEAGRVDPEIYVRNIKAGVELHNNAMALIDHLISTGHRDWLIRDYLISLLKPVSDGGTLGQIDNMIRTWRQKTDTPDPEEEDFNAPPPGRTPLPLEWFADIKPNLSAADFVEGLLCEAGLTVLYGESNCGKTFFITDLAFHIAAGRRWRGREIEAGGVIYVALEGGFGIRNRLAALRVHYNVGSEGVPLGIVPCSINMLDENADTGPLIDLIIEAAKRIGMPVRLVVIDTLSRAMNGGNENASEDMGRVVKSADRIREQTGAHVVFVHHSGKDQAKGARGHSSLRAATDTEIEITRAEGSDCSVACVKKQRELELEGEFAFELKQISLGANRRGKEVTSCVVNEIKAPETPKTVRMTETERGFMDEIRELFNRGDNTELVSPERGMPVLITVTREVLRDWLIRRGKLDVTVGVTVLNGAERARLFRALTSLANKGIIGINKERLWLL